MAQGAETSGGGWRVAGVGVVQVDDPPRRERRWGAGVAERSGKAKSLMMVGEIGRRKDQEISRNGCECGAGGAE